MEKEGTDKTSIFPSEIDGKQIWFVYSQGTTRRATTAEIQEHMRLQHEEATRKAEADRLREMQSE